MRITNKHAYSNYAIQDQMEAGVSLLGSEVKAIRTGHADITGSFVRIMGNEAYLVNAKVYPYPYARPESYQEARSRKLLLHKKELIALRSKTDGQHLTIVPLALYTKGQLIKLAIGLGKGKKQFEKRGVLKQKAINRDIERELKNK